MRSENKCADSFFVFLGFAIAFKISQILTTGGEEGRAAFHYKGPMNKKFDDGILNRRLLDKQDNSMISARPRENNVCCCCCCCCLTENPGMR